jgi:transcriptional regulator with XRE-family HTH domain
MSAMNTNPTRREPDTTLEQRVATNVRAALAARRMTSADLSKVLHLEQRAAQRRLNGTTPFTLSEMGKVAAWLGVSYSALVAPIAFEAPVAHLSERAA